VMYGLDNNYLHVVPQTRRPLPVAYVAARR